MRIRKAVLSKMSGQPGAFGYLNAKVNMVHIIVVTIRAFLLYWITFGLTNSKLGCKGSSQMIFGVLSCVSETTKLDGAMAYVSKENWDMVWMFCLEIQPDFYMACFAS